MQKINQLKSWVSAQKVRDTCNIEVSVTNDHRYVLFVIITIWFLAHSWFITGFITRVTGRMPHVEQELLALPEHMSSSPVFSGVCVARSSFVDLCLSFWPLYCLFFNLRLLITSLWYRQTLLSEKKHVGHVYSK
jgi:cytochrome bd-type quinol oxidase subunit 1